MGQYYYVQLNRDAKT